MYLILFVLIIGNVSSICEVHIPQNAVVLPDGSILLASVNKIYRVLVTGIFYFIILLIIPNYQFL